MVAWQVPQIQETIFCSMDSEPVLYSSLLLLKDRSLGFPKNVKEKDTMALRYQLVAHRYCI